MHWLGLSVEHVHGSIVVSVALVLVMAAVLVTHSAVSVSCTSLDHVSHGSSKLILVVVSAAHIVVGALV